MDDGPTPRQRVRTESLARIKDLALEQLAERGAQELSLRRIARELNLVSSALYRYFPSRDALLTALIVDAYADLAGAVERAGVTGRGRTPRRRWLDGCRAARSWAREQPHRFALVYGSAIPGYRAPTETIAPATGVLVAFLRPALEATTAADARAAGDVPTGLGEQLRAAAGELATDADPAILLTLVGAFSRLVGLLTLELNGHLVGGFEPADELFEVLLAREADDLGL